MNVDFAETDRRLLIFHENMKTAEKLQSLDQGSAEYGVTKFSDLTGLYFRSFRGGNPVSPFCVLLQPLSTWSSLINTRFWLVSFCVSTEEEFRSTYLNPMLSQWALHRQMKPASPAKAPAPDSWDWRDHGAVSSVKNQVPTNRVNH